MVADDRTKVGLRYRWEKWGASAKQLKAAIEKVGPIARDVARQLGNSA